jgi:hypothetical protein
MGTTAEIGYPGSIGLSGKQPGFQKAGLFGIWRFTRAPSAGTCLVGGGIVRPNVI